MNPLARAGRLLAGVLVGALAFSLVLRAHLGLGPWHVLQEGIATRLGISLGHAAWVMGGGLLAVALALREWPGPGTALIVLLGGGVLDLVLPHVGTPRAMVARVAFLAAGTVIMALGGALVISADVGMAPLDAVMTGICRSRRGRLYRVRVALEALGLLLGWRAGGEIGVGCLVIGLGIGPGLQFWLGRLRPPARLEVSVA